MGRRSITDEASDDQPTSSPDDHDNDSDDTETVSYSQRMPEPLADDADDLGDQLGMSRNAVVNMAVRQYINSYE